MEMWRLLYIHKKINEKIKDKYDAMLHTSFLYNYCTTLMTA